MISLLLLLLLLLLMMMMMMICIAEIVAGDVFINSNPRLCHIHTIGWRDILNNRNFTVFVNLTDKSPARCTFLCSYNLLTVSARRG